MRKKYNDPKLERLEAKRKARKRLTTEKAEKDVNAFLITMALIFIFLGGMYMEFYYSDFSEYIRAAPNPEQKRFD